MLVMKLVEQGVLDLDKPLQDYVKRTALAEQRYGLARGPERPSDRSALPADHRPDVHEPHHRPARTGAGSSPIRSCTFTIEPGEKFSYSGEGMTLLQIVIEKITAKPLEQLMHEHIFGPYGMTMSSYTWQPRFEADYAVGHRQDGKPYPKDKDNAARAPSTLETTTDDYARFMAAVLRGDGLKPASWNEMFKPQMRIRTRTQFGPGCGGDDLGERQDRAELRAWLGPAANAVRLGRLQGRPWRRLPALFDRLSRKEDRRAADEQQRQRRKHLWPLAHADDCRHFYAPRMGKLHSI